MNRNLLISLSLSCVLMLLSACVTSLSEFNARSQMLSKDQALSNEFYPLSGTSTAYEIRVEPDRLRYLRYFYTLKSDLVDAIDTYNIEDSSNDELAQRYVAFAKSRGNGVKLYSAPVNQKIIGLFGVPSALSNDVVRSNLDPALIEVAPDGRIVSALVRIHGFVRPLATFLQSQYSYIYSGPNARKIETRLGGSSLTDNLIRSL